MKRICVLILTVSISSFSLASYEPKKISQVIRQEMSQIEARGNASANELLAIEDKINTFASIEPRMAFQLKWKMAELKTRIVVLS